MLKELSSLLCSLFVPRRSGIGGGRTIYGIEASSIGIPDYSSYITVNIPDGTSPTYTAKGSYTVPYDALVTATSIDPQQGLSGAGVALSVASNDQPPTIICCVRRELYNNTIFVIAKKGDVVTYSLTSTGNYLRIYKLLPV